MADLHLSKLNTLNIKSWVRKEYLLHAFFSKIYIWAYTIATRSKLMEKYWQGQNALQIIMCTSFAPKYSITDSDWTLAQQKDSQVYINALGELGWWMGNKRLSKERCCARKGWYFSSRTKRDTITLPLLINFFFENLKYKTIFFGKQLQLHPLILNVIKQINQIKIADS